MKYTVSDAMNRALLDLDAERLIEDTETEASIRTTIARILCGNAKFDEALALAQWGIDARRGLSEHDSLGMVESLNVVAICLMSLGRSSEALPLKYPNALRAPIARRRLPF